MMKFEVCFEKNLYVEVGQKKECDTHTFLHYSGAGAKLE
jgi:hypothetical protein